MYLADPVQIRDDLGFDDMADINEAIANAMSAATTLIEARLDTTFDQGQATDTFLLPREESYSRRLFAYTNQQVGVRPSGKTVLFRLRQGFVSGLNAAAGCDLADAVAVAPSVLGSAYDLERGVLRDFTTVYTGGYMQVSYTYGFPPSPQDPTIYDLDVVPDWLQQAAKLRAKVMLSGSPPLEAASIKIDTKTLNAEYLAILSRKLRYAPTALNPL